MNNTHADPKKTGELDAVEDNMTAPVQDNEWFTYEILVQGKRIVTRINGQTIVDYAEPENANRSDRQLSDGLFALQAHDPDSKVQYRKIEVMRMD